MKKMIVLTALSMLLSGIASLAQADEQSSGCISNVKGVAVAFAENRNNRYKDCSVVGEPLFDTSRGPGSGLVSVELDCHDEQLQVDMLWINDSDGGCEVSHVRFWNP